MQGLRCNAQSTVNKCTHAEMKVASPAQGTGSQTSSQPVLVEVADPMRLQMDALAELMSTCPNAMQAGMHHICGAGAVS